MTSKIAIVTGGATRIGAGIALHLANQGWQVVIHYNKSSREAKELSKRINSVSKSIVLKLDFMKLSGFDKFFQQVVSKLGVPSLLVNNAAMFEKDNITNISARKLESHMRVNCFAPILLTQKFIEVSRCHPGGSGDDTRERCAAYIVNILDSSINFDSSKSFLSYSLSKSSLLQATKLLSVQVRPNIRVSVINPGFVMQSKGKGKSYPSTKQTTSIAQICRELDAILDAKRGA